MAKILSGAKAERKTKSGETGARPGTETRIVRASVITLKDDSLFGNEPDQPATEKSVVGMQVLRRASFLLTVLLTAATARAQSGVDPAQMANWRARAAIATGQVTRLQDKQPWAISTGDLVPVAQTLSTGSDGFARMTLEGGTAFELLSDSKVLFRQNVSNPNDILDVLAGRVRLQLRPRHGEMQRVFSQTAIISTRLPSSFAMAIDEDDNVRIDVTEGQILVQHARLPTNESVMVKAIDSILVEKNESISRRVDRGTLYRYSIRIWSALTFGHVGHEAEPIEGNKLVDAGHSLRFCF